MKLDIIYNEDCLEGMKRLPNESIDLILTDPLYKSQYQYLWRPLAKESKRILKKGGSLVTLFGHYQLPLVLTELSSHLRYWWIGGLKQRRTNRFAGKWVFIKFKPCLWFVKDYRRIAGNYLCPFDLYEENNCENWKIAKKFCPDGQPIGFFINWIKYLTNINDVVLDPFMGSGTTAIACKQLDRYYIGFEINPEYCEIAKKRLSNEKIN